MERPDAGPMTVARHRFALTEHFRGTNADHVLFTTPPGVWRSVEILATPQTLLSPMN